MLQPPTKEHLTALAEGINTRFLEEVKTLKEHGYAGSDADIVRHLGARTSFFWDVNNGRGRVKLSHIRRLKDVYNADYHYILFGVENPDPVRRGTYRKAQGAPPQDKELIARLDGWINYRFIKEVERMEREGRIINRVWLSQLLGTDNNTLNLIRGGKQSVQPLHLPLLKEAVNADYHFILWGFERPDISMPMKVVNKQPVRIDVYPRYIFRYSKPATWSPLLPERDAQDDMKRLEKGYYLDLRTLSEQ